MRIILGIFCIVIGAFFRWLAIQKLRRNFTLTLEYPTKIETTGIYFWCRHPSYLGSVLIILGLSLLNPVLGIIAISGMFFLARVVNEEKILNLNPDYRIYTQKTGMFFPHRNKKKVG